MQSENTYFAAKEAKDCANILLNRGESFYNTMRSNAYLDKITRMWRAYHGAYNDGVGFGHQVEFTGEQGELVSLPVNHFRNLARITYNMVTATRPVMQARAINTDSKSLAQTYLANGILEYYMREKNLEYHLKKAVEYAIVLGSGLEGIEHELILIKSENEKLMKGINPLVAPTDQHREHILEHKTVIADPELREDPELVKAVMDHIESHMNALRNVDPDLLSMIQENALPPAGAVPPPMDGQQSGAGQVMEQQQGLPQGGDMISGPGLDGQALPSMPTPPEPFSNLPTDPSQLPTR